MTTTMIGDDNNIDISLKCTLFMNLDLQRCQWKGKLLLATVFVFFSPLLPPWLLSWSLSWLVGWTSAFLLPSPPFPCLVGWTTAPVTTALCNQPGPSTTEYSQVQPSTAKYNQVAFLLIIHFQKYSISEIERIALSSCLDRSILSLPGLTTTSIKLAYLIVMIVMMVMMMMIVQQARLGGNCKILIGPLPLAADASYGWLGPIFLKLGYSHSLSRYSSIFFQLGSS